MIERMNMMKEMMLLIYVVTASQLIVEYVTFTHAIVEIYKSGPI